MKTWPTLYKLDSKGKLRVWEISADRGVMITVHGVDGGNLQSTRVQCKPKNVGKKNATTSIKQAELEAASKWRKQQDRRYTTDPSGVSTQILPMLAKRFQDYAHQLTGAVYLQPKLNGVRCLAIREKGGVRLVSRLGKDYTHVCKHLTVALEGVLRDGQVLDGELYNHKLTFQETTRRVKKYRPGKTEKIRFHLYDILSDEPYDARLASLQRLTRFLSKRMFPLIKFMRYSQLVDGIVKVYNKRMIMEGYEGVIIRSANKGGYEIDVRSKHLQKYKEFHDKEVKIVGATQGKGKEEGCVIWQVQDEFGNTFMSRPKGTHEQRRKWYALRAKYMGKKMTIRYQELSEDNVPVFNVGIAIRDYE